MKFLREIVIYSTDQAIDTEYGITFLNNNDNDEREKNQTRESDEMIESSNWLNVLLSVSFIVSALCYKRATDTVTINWNGFSNFAYNNNADHSPTTTKKGRIFFSIETSSRWYDKLSRHWGSTWNFVCCCCRRRYFFLSFISFSRLFLWFTVVVVSHFVRLYSRLSHTLSFDVTKRRRFFFVLFLTSCKKKFTTSFQIINLR